MSTVYLRACANGLGIKLSPSIAHSMSYKSPLPWRYIFLITLTSSKIMIFLQFTHCFNKVMCVLLIESTYKKCLREEWGKFTGYQLLSSFWLKVARTDEDGNTTRWDRGTLPIRNLYLQWGMLRFGRIRKVTNWILILWFIVSYWWVT